jgi:hypothetical protein
MAMNLSLLGLRTPGIEIPDPSCVTKVHPDFLSDLARLPDREDGHERKWLFAVEGVVAGCLGRWLSTEQWAIVRR